MADETFQSWAIVEVMGHKRFAGRVSEQVIAGQGFIRVDVPEAHGLAGFTKLLGTGSIYAITPVGEREARVAAEAFRERPVEAWMVRELEDRGSTSSEDLDEDPTWDTTWICDDCGSTQTGTTCAVCNG